MCERLNQTDMHRQPNWSSSAVGDEEEPGLPVISMQAPNHSRCLTASWRALIQDHFIASTQEVW
jgi:hypothetical protein